LIEAGLEFRSEAFDQALAAFLSLPPGLAPGHFTSDEREPESESNSLANPEKFLVFVSNSKSGFFLKGAGLTYSIRLVAEKAAICDCFLDVEPRLAVEFLAHMAEADPAFGFACLPEERERRNRVILRFGVNTIESWVGRDARRYIPGLYWLTLLPQALAERHAVPLSRLAEAAVEHTRLGPDQHLFRFYHEPRDWVAHESEMDGLYALCPGIFDVRKVEPLLSNAKTIIEATAVLSGWK